MLRAREKVFSARLRVLDSFSWLTRTNSSSEVRCLSCCLPRFILRIVGGLGRVLRFCILQKGFVAVATGILLFGRSTLACAGDGTPATGSTRPHFEFSSGAQIFDRAWSLYSGATIAPFGGIQQDGARLRVVAGYGAYSYSSLHPTATLPILQKFRGEATFAELLAGYQVQVGPITLKAFLGVEASDHRIEPFDTETSIIGAGWGGKAVLENWWNIGDQTWASLDLAWATLHDSYSARLRLGWRVVPALSLGLEAGAVGNQESGGAKLGPFIRYEWATGELSVCGGFASDRPWDQPWGAVAHSSAPFVTVSWLTRF